MLREEGIASFYNGLGPSLIGVVPYIAVDFAITRVKKSLLEKYQKKPQTSLATALFSASLTTLMCYPLDTARRQMQMKGSPYSNIFYAFPANLYIYLYTVRFIILYRTARYTQYVPLR
ncbi:hypothetical protein BHE74_00050918 [Ensete ventricosum]|nr:hypothetical protein GW17_00032653 [Ensete ventricosum]RWW43422.1 hypothetical protein BHE74_00050918 [Ensete ventricosum]RZS28313.1 hypothetical protein BHM03_00061884 [Ensete ventricosum]